MFLKIVNRASIFLWVLALFFVLAGTEIAAQRASGSSDCPQCARRGTVSRASSNLAPYKENPELLLASTRSRLAEALTGPCFHLLHPEALESSRGEGRGDVSSPAGKPPEYFFSVDFSRQPVDASGGAAPGGTRLILEMFYNGAPSESVFRIHTDSPLEDYSSHVNRMYQNPDAEIRRVQPIEEILRDFERRPVTCEISLEERETVPLGEIPVSVKGFRDWKGRPSREFNRIVVRAERGRIIGGTSILENPSWQAFQVGAGEVKFRYQAPAECDPPADQILVFSSCEILDPAKQPMEWTRSDRKIAEAAVPILCARGVVTIRYESRMARINDRCLADTLVHHQATLELGLGDQRFALPFGMEGSTAAYHPVLYRKIRSAEAVLVDRNGEKKEGRDFRFAGPAASGHGPDIVVVRDPATKRVIGVPGFGILLAFTWSDGKTGSFSGPALIKGSSLGRASGGDGFTSVHGGETARKVDDCVEWTETLQWELRFSQPSEKKGLPTGGKPDSRAASLGLLGRRTRKQRRTAATRLTPGAQRRTSARQALRPVQPLP